MRIIRYGERGNEQPGLWRDGKIVALRALFPDIPDVDRTFFEGGWIAKLAGVTDPGRVMGVRLGPPVAAPSKIICLGKNYAEHAHEGGFKNPEKPLLFAKTPNTLNGPEDPILMPVSCGQIDWEVELAVVIGKAGKRITRDQAYEHVAGVTVMNDVSGREAQYSDAQWFRGKSFDTFAPLGPMLVTLDEIGDPQQLSLSTRVDGVVMQTGTTADMIFDIPAILAYISADITLLPGDIIATGTPAGVGIFRDPPVTLQPGNLVECQIEKIGCLRNRCR